MLKLAVLMNTLCIGLSTALIYFPSAAVLAMCREAGRPHLRRADIEFLAPHLIGPLTALIASVLLRVFLVRRLQIPLWPVAIGALGAVYSITALRGGYAHDFSHVVCDACTGYATIILIIASSTAILLALTYLAQKWHDQRSMPASHGH